MKEEVESPLTEDIVRQLRALRELSEAPGPESPSLGAPGLGAPGLGACPLCEAPMRLHLLPLHHGVPHHLPCLLHYGRNYTSEEDRHQHRLSYHRLPTAHLYSGGPPAAQAHHNVARQAHRRPGPRHSLPGHPAPGGGGAAQRRARRTRQLLRLRHLLLLRLHLLLLLLELRSVGAGPEEPAPAPRRQQADQEPLER